jgi:hypothetical protein
MQHHWRRQARWTALGIILLASRGMAAEAQQPPETVVLLADGRALTGHLDAQTDAQTLWIRQSEGGVVLRSGFDWSRVAAVLQDGQSQDKQDVLRATAQLNTLTSEEALPAAEPFAAFPPEAPHELSGIPSPPPFAGPASLQIGQVGFANWNRDAAIDGLEASLCIVDDFGQCVPVPGQLEITLTGTRQDVFGGVHIRRQRPLFVEIGRWSIPLRGPAPLGDEIWLRLPFTRIGPFDPTIADRAILHMRFNIPGSGTFEATRIITLH